MKLIKTIQSRWAAFMAFAMLLILSVPKAGAAIVAHDSGTGAVTFTPGELVTPIIVGIIAAITAAAAIATIFMGVRWIIKAVKLLRG